MKFRAVLWTFFSLLLVTAAQFISRRSQPFAIDADRDGKLGGHGAQAAPRQHA